MVLRLLCLNSVHRLFRFDVISSQDLARCFYFIYARLMASLLGSLNNIGALNH
ncbi:hypothetical protein ES703_54931 [subsurface metagenome]